jgi:hypothetical protein
MTEDEKREARARRRASEAKNRKTPLSSPLTTEPPALIEALRTPLITRLVEIADTTQDEGLEANIRFRLLGLSSLGRQKVELTAELAKADVPDLSALPPDQLLEIIRLSQTLTAPITIEIPEKTEGNGHRAAAEESPPS